MSETSLQLLRGLAASAMRARGLDPDFPPAALAQVRALQGSPPQPAAGARDLRNLLWCSIDNDSSRDLDQLSVAEALPDGGCRLWVAIADVDGAVPAGTALDEHARQNTVSVYTPGTVFPMLPEPLSTDLTSLIADVDRAAMVAELTFTSDGATAAADFYPAVVRNRAKLAYNSVAAWLDGKAAPPPALAAVPGLEANLRLQDGIAEKLRIRRHRRGALELETIRAQAVFKGETLLDLEAERQNRAQKLIEDVMIAANHAAVEFLAAHGLPCVRRVLREPKDWGRLREFAAAHGGTLPPAPDATALQQFLLAQRERDPVGFCDLSLAVIKLLGRGEYVAERPGGSAPGHFGLAVDDYLHSTAPNRRYPDVITQRLIKAAIAQRPSPYSVPALDALAQRCTAMSDAAKKVERQMGKSAAALFLRPKIGQTFDALVTGTSPKATWVRLLGGSPVEGQLCHPPARIKVADRLRVRLSAVDVPRGLIDFERA